MTDSSGQSVAAPLRKGSPFCLFHAQPFSTKPATVEGPIVILYLDLETTGVAVSRARICELAAAHGPELAHAPGECFSEVLYVPVELRQTPESQAAARVHGIHDDDISCGTPFAQSWLRFLAFTEACLNNMIHDGSDDSEDEPAFSRPPDEPPTLVLVGHNSFRFDFAMLLFECERHQLSMSPFRKWLFVDTLHVLEATKAELGAACLKLQCLYNTMTDGTNLRAHRALDDCIALRLCCHTVACRLGCTVADLLCKFAFQWDEQTSRVQIAALIEA